MGDVPPARLPDCVPSLQAMLVEIIVVGPRSRVNRSHAEIARSADTGAQTIFELVVRDQPGHQTTNRPTEFVASSAIYHLQPVPPRRNIVLPLLGPSIPERVPFRYAA